MFDVDENGQMQYIPDPDNTPDPDLPGDSLYSPPVDQAEEMEASPSPAPEEESGMETDNDPDQAIDQLTSTSGNNTYQLVIPGLEFDSEDMAITTSGDIYIYPDLPEEETFALDDTRSSTSATVTGLPNSSSLQFLEDVSRGYPSWYMYLCFKTDASYSQSQVLYIGEKAEKNPSQNRIDFTNVDKIEVNYIRQSSSSSYYQYTKTHYDSFQVSYNTDVFLYTNVVDGYAEFDIPSSKNPVYGLLIPLIAVICMILGIQYLKRN